MIECSCVESTALTAVKSAGRQGRRIPSHGRAVLRFSLLATFLVSCADSPVAPVSDPAPELGALFTRPTAAEKEAVIADWLARDVSAQGYREELSGAVTLGHGVGATLRVVSHTVTGARHFGAIIVPDGAAAGTLPVLVYAHGGDRGVSAGEAVILTTLLGNLAGSFVYVVPSFRSETLRVGSAAWTSEGEASTWDYDVDDALALLNLVIAHVPAADTTRLVALGQSRGGNVALLMSARDPRIDAVVEFFGPTDFFDSFVREIIEEAAAGSVRDLPGVAMLNQRYLQPFLSGAVTIDEMRHQLLLRSSAHFADRLRAAQVHHGTADNVVAVSQAHSLIAELEALGRGPPAFDFHIYSGGQHDPFTLPGSAERTIAYLEPVVRPD